MWLFLLKANASEDGPSVVGAGFQIKHIGSTLLQFLQDGCFPGPGIAVEGHKLDLFEQYGNHVVDRAAVVFVAAFHPVDIHPQRFEQGKNRTTAESSPAAEDDDLVVGFCILLEEAEHFR